MPTIQIGHAQSLSIGPTFIYGDDIEQVGVQVRSYYNFKGGRICFGPEFSYFFPKTENHDGEETTRNLSEVNFNLHYVFEIAEGWGIYPVTGANMSFEKEEIKLQNGETEHENITAFGVNLGIGVHRTVNHCVFFAEYDHLFSDLSQSSYLIGVFYTFGKRSENHE